MPNHIDIDYRHSRAIIQEIGERLQEFLKVDPELPTGLKMQINQLRRLEDQSQPTKPKQTLRWWERPRGRG